MNPSDGDEPDGTEPLLSVARHSSADTLTVVLAGELTAVDRGLDLLGGWLTARTRHVVVDVARLEFVDVADLRVLLRAQDRCAGQQTTFTLLRPSPYLRWLAEISDVSPALITDLPDDERDERLTDRELLADERDRLLDERSDALDARRDWEDIREDLVHQRELRLERRERDDRDDR
ncbi:STAS domain-containing protein [Actinoplanes aureus]|uniref:STAS domain-containing protein n=1 Tax=Actinoplanes aureus TaxID=2792083 RepID=A0A931CAY9_9ACTN|nr:STAS domain-containing protein [Actinoplanes aureus]MBG0564051.1 STAS domain-containing protein [Actinoplanes aureus]